MDMLRRCDKGESTAAIRRVYPVGDNTLHYIKKDREKIMTAVESGAGSLFRIRPRLPQPPTLQHQQEGGKELRKEREIDREREKRKKERMNGGR